MKKLAILLIFVFAITSMGVSAQYDKSTMGVLQSGSYYTIVNKASGKVLGIGGGSLDNGAAVMQWDSDGTYNQKWRCELAGTGYYMLVAAHSGKLLNVAGASKEDGGRLIQWPQSNTDNERWKFVSTGDGYYNIIALHSGKVLGVEAGSVERGARVVQWRDDGTDNQRWRLEETSLVTYYTIVNKASRKVLGIGGGSLDDGAAVMLWDNDGTNNQKWRREPAGTGYYMLVAAHSGKLLNVAGASREDGGRLIQWPQSNTDNERWKFVSTGDGYYNIIALHSGKVLGVEAGSVERGARVVQWRDDGTDNQRWRLEETSLAIKPPLHVPSYMQVSNFWCNLASISDAVKYHAKDCWPGGRFGSQWFGANPWYLAGKAGQPRNIGYFWENTFHAVGILSPSPSPDCWGPDDCSHLVDYSGLDLEYRQWLFNSSDPDDWFPTWNLFRAYVQSQLWGFGSGEPRPVVIGRSHTRVITGSDSVGVYINDPGGGTFEYRTWEAFRLEMEGFISSSTSIEKEGYGTLVFSAPSVAEEYRRGALLLRDFVSPGEPGTVTLRSEDGRVFSRWRWGGDDGHALGYWFDANRVIGSGNARRTERFPTALPEDDLFGHAWQSTGNDTLEYQFYVQNTTFDDYKYDAEIWLMKLVYDDIPLPLVVKRIPHIKVGKRAKGLCCGGIGNAEKRSGQVNMDNLAHGYYAVWFLLFQGGNLQDMKAIKFSVVE